MLLAEPAAACPAPGLPSEAARPLTAGPPDQTLFAAAVLAEVNAFRCANGRPALVAAGGLTAVAAEHSRWQAEKERLSHESTLRGLRTLGDRLRAAGIAYRSGAENVAYTAACRQSYASLAREAVAMWRDSSGHRANMLKRDVRLAGAGVGVAARRGVCTGIYVTLELAG